MKLFHSPASPFVRKVVVLLHELVILLLRQCAVFQQCVKKTLGKTGSFSAAFHPGRNRAALFGNLKGSFTGAERSGRGYFREAEGGSLFLDELATTSMLVQEKLLRVIEYGEFERVGGSKTLTTDVRLIAATNEDLPTLANKGKFREDLYYRLNTVPIFIPPLRERKEDIVLLFRKFASDFAEKYRTTPVRLDDKAQLVLENYSWSLI